MLNIEADQMRQSLGWTIGREGGGEEDWSESKQSKGAKGRRWGLHPGEKDKEELETSR
jgi:hypothetical protein